jgi:hypothetical protein
LRHLTRRQKRALKAKVKELVVELAAGIGCGLVSGGLFIGAFMFDTYEPPSPPEHYGQIEYCGVWWDIDDYEAMMAEREEYLRAEQESEQAFYNAVLNAQVEQNMGTTISKTGIGSMDWDKSQGVLYFERTTDEDTWHNTHLKELFKHGNHTFYTEKQERYGNIIRPLYAGHRKETTR